MITAVYWGGGGGGGGGGGCYASDHRNCQHKVTFDGLSDS